MARPQRARFTEEQMRDIEDARERLWAWRDKFQKYPALPEEEPSKELPDGNYTVVHIHRSIYPYKKKKYTKYD